MPQEIYTGGGTENMDSKSRANCRVYACVHQKGGVGKSVSSTNLGIGLVRRGFKVLIAKRVEDLTNGWKPRKYLDQKKLTAT